MPPFNLCFFACVGEVNNAIATARPVIDFIDMQNFLFNRKLKVQSNLRITLNVVYDKGVTIK
ncbi:hypothetical protein PROPEN_03285 [Proteus penneri ATCC 35198]|nr:hypothetical protein PROPEN_03285 [Proteus penneri ATCC 35198]